MRIGELAALVGVSTRAVRHYHHQGLLPEPPRKPNGYRDYQLRDAVRLARVRRLTALGLGLDEVRDVLADDTGAELRDVLGELDDELRRQEAEIRARRVRLAELLRQAEDGTLPDSAPLSPELTGFLARAATSAPESAIAAKDRDVLALLETSAPPEARDSVLAMAGTAVADEAAAARAQRAYALLDALEDAAPRDPRVPEAARAVAACVPEETVAAMPVVPEGESPLSDAFAKALYADLAPAQAEAVRQAITLLTERNTP